jgi:hypothetical protein
MRPAHFHAFGRYLLDGLLEVDFRSAHAAPPPVGDGRPMTHVR